MGKIPEGGTSKFSFVIEIKWSEILMELWLLSRLHEHIPRKIMDSKVRNGIRHMWSFLGGYSLNFSQLPYTAGP